MRIISHRGKHEDHSWPDNTLAAVKSVWSKGITGVEIDVWVTKDGMIVLNHGKKVKTAGGRKLSIPDTMYSELAGVKLHHGQPIALLIDVLCTMPAEARMFVDVKCGEEIIEPLETLLENSDIGTDQLAFIGFIDDDSHKHTMKRVCEVFDDFDIYVLFGRNGKRERLLTMDKEARVSHVLAETEDINAKGFDIHLELANDSLFKKAKDKKLGCHVWGIEDLEERDRVSVIGADSITTDKPKTLINACT